MKSMLKDFKVTETNTSDLKKLRTNPQNSPSVDISADDPTGIMLSLISSLKVSFDQLQAKNDKLSDVAQKIEVSIGNQNELISDLNLRVTKNESEIVKLTESHANISVEHNRLVDGYKHLKGNLAYQANEMTALTEKLDEVEQNSYADRIILSGPKIVDLFKKFPDKTNIFRRYCHNK